VCSTEHFVKQILRQVSFTIASFAHLAFKRLGRKQF